MSREWAIIVDNIIGNVILADEEFVASHPDWSQFERIDITDLNPKPGITWKIEDGKFKKSEYVLPKEEHILQDEYLETEVPN
jgi:predicted RecB family nuclease